MSARQHPSGEVDHAHLLRLLGTTALVVLALGVLPLMWDASVVWRVLGPLAALAITAHTARVIWQTVFSTDPRHLGTAG